MKKGTYRYYGVLLGLPLESPIFTYRLEEDDTSPEELLGRVVLVPLGAGKTVSGVVWSYQGTVSPLPLGKVKSIRKVLSHPVIPGSVRKFWSWVASYYMCSLGDVFRAALPASFRPEGGQRYMLPDTVGGEEAETLRKELGRSYFSLKELRQLFPDDYADLFSSWSEEGSAVPYEKGIGVAGIPAHERGWGVSAQVYQPEMLEEVRKSLKRSPQVLKALDRLVSDLEGSNLFFPTLTEVGDYLGVSSYVIGRLREYGVIEERAREEVLSEGTPGKKPNLNGVTPDFRDHQILLLHMPHSRADERVPLRHLYEQVTEAGGQVLLLFPTLDRLREVEGEIRQVFGASYFPYHTGVSLSDRQRTYLAAWRKRPGLYVGLRSAVWLPLGSLSEVVVIDSEHRGYRQWEPAPRFTASDAVLVLAALSGAKSLIVSSTPSVESMAQVLRGKYALQTAVSTPSEGRVSLQTVSMRTAFDDNQVQARLLSDVMVGAIRETIAKREKVLLLYQRPGYARSIECQDCGEQILCPRCHTACRLSADARTIECPLCGYKSPLPASCPHCNHPSLRAVGTGIERLQEAVSRYFAGAQVATVGSDDRVPMADIMLCPDYDPPVRLLRQVSMVGVIQLDLLLTLPDHRAAERAYRMLTSCRDELRDGGRLIIQYFSKSPVLDAFLEDDYQTFIEHEMEERHQLLFQPFCRITDLVLEGKSQPLISRFADRVAGELSRLLPAVQILGPTPLPVSKRAASFGFRVTLLIPLDVALSPLRTFMQSTVAGWVKTSGIPSLRYYYDVDP
ncbi:hypothetical protein [uncultured Porphyromonas sp.]|uniref:primosomal protein N' family DNA-binding protein n=1 Tax=uncultured Porphyromonas sp. TaxID=159274 RepID=UPI002623A3F0|nr:hypothetical protein [uncultured Porphyromonas sp.]